jgi:putative ABC transport system permease protein
MADNTQKLIRDNVRPPVAPPRWADRLLETCLDSHLLEDVQGDLHEVFSKRLNEVGFAKARREYAWAVLHYLSPFFFKPQRRSDKLPGWRVQPAPAYREHRILPAF